MTRILIADDHEIVRSGIRRIIENQVSWSIVAEAADGKQAIDKSIATKPDVAILDCSLPLINGIEVTRQIRLRMPCVEVLLYTMHESETLLRDACKAGARGYVLKSATPQHLIAAIGAVAARRPFLTGAGSDAFLDTLLNQEREIDQLLSPRERSVVQLVAEGHSNKQLANVLGISVKTVETHRAAILRKLDLTSTTALVRYAIRNKLIEA